MNTISKLALRGMSYGVFLVIMAMQITMPATALACACCAEPGAWFQDKARADPEVLAIIGELGGRLGPSASLHLTAAGIEEVKGISPAAETYTLRRLRPHTRDWKLEFTDAGGNRGALAFTIPDTAVYYGVDLQDGRQAGAGGPLLYKEWRFEGPITGTGIFRGGMARGARFHLIFQGRGNMCRNPDDFKSWVLQVKGPRSDYAFYGSISSRARQSARAGQFGKLSYKPLAAVDPYTQLQPDLNRNKQYWDTRRYGTGSGSDLALSGRTTYEAPGRYRSLYRTDVPWFDLAQNEGLSLERTLFRGGLRPAVTSGLAFNYAPTIEALANYPKYGGPSSLSPADYYGAISYSQSSRRFGSAWAFPSQNEAEQRALASCNREDCQIVIWFKNACGSLARARNGAIAWSGGKDLIEAKRLASNECTRRWGSCKLICSVCSRGDAP